MREILLKSILVISLFGVVLFNVTNICCYLRLIIIITKYLVQVNNHAVSNQLPKRLLHTWNVGHDYQFKLKQITL